MTSHFDRLWVSEMNWARLVSIDGLAYHQMHIWLVRVVS